MTYVPVNTGTTEGDGTGDSAKIAFDKINAGFAEVAISSGSTTPVLNGATGVYTAKCDWYKIGDLMTAFCSVAYDSGISGGRIEIDLNLPAGEFRPLDATNFMRSVTGSLSMISLATPGAVSISDSYSGGTILFVLDATGTVINYTDLDTSLRRIKFSVTGLYDLD